MKPVSLSPKMEISFQRHISGATDSQIISDNA